LHFVNHNASDSSGRRTCGNSDQQWRSDDRSRPDTCSRTDRATAQCALVCRVQTSAPEDTANQSHDH
jgi:hypothetical protein